MQTLNDIMKEKDWRYSFEISWKQAKKESSRRISRSITCVYSYKLLNDHVKFLHPKLTSLDKSIKQAMMPIPFEVYVSSMVFFSMIAGICGMVMGVIASQFINIQPASIGMILPLLSGIDAFWNDIWNIANNSCN